MAIAIGLFGDVSMKQAGIGGLRWGWLACGYGAYSTTSFAWFWLLKTRTLSTFGTLYPIANAIGLIILGVLLFHESLDRRTMVGIGLGIVSMWLLSGNKP